MSHSLSAFLNLDDSYTVLDTETTGLPDEAGPPGIVSLGMTLVEDREISDSREFRVRPYRKINVEAQRIHGITNDEADRFPPISAYWQEISSWLNDRTIVIHNANFDWPIVQFHIEHFQLAPLRERTIFCSQKSAIEFAGENDIPMSSRGPSLDDLSQFLGITSLRKGGIHGAEIDTRQTALVVEALRKLAYT